MSDELEELARRLVIGHKSDGRKVFDETAKAELVALCSRTGTSVSRMARQVDVNANQLSRWIREHQQGRQREVVARAVSTREAFVAMPVVATSPVDRGEDRVGAMALQAWLPNGAVVDLRGVGQRQALELLEALGRMRCSVSTKG